MNDFTTIQDIMSQGKTPFQNKNLWTFKVYLRFILTVFQQLGQPARVVRGLVRVEEAKRDGWEEDYLTEVPGSGLPLIALTHQQ